MLILDKEELFPCFMGHSVFLQYFNNFYIFLIFQNAENKISAELVTRTYVKNSSFKVRLYII